jgi:predicted permease
MEIGMVLLKQIVIMFLLMAVGFYLYRQNIITDQGSRDIGKILLYLVIPVVVVMSFWIERTPETTESLFHSSLLSTAAMVLSVSVSWMIFYNNDGVACFSSSFSNVGFIGIPLVQAVLGSSAVFYISIMIVIVNILQWTVGIFMITRNKESMDIKKLIRNPIVISVAIGMILYFLRIPCPPIADTLCTAIKGLNTPLAMLVSGVYLAQSDLLKMIKQKKTWIVCAVRLVVIPLLTIILLKWIPFGSDTLKLAVLLAAACPVGSNVAIFAQQYHADYREAAEHVCISTVSCLFTLPLIAIVGAYII